MKYSDQWKKHKAIKYQPKWVKVVPERLMTKPIPNMSPKKQPLLATCKKNTSHSNIQSTMVTCLTIMKLTNKVMVPELDVNDGIL